VDRFATLIAVRHANTDATVGGQPVLCGRFDSPLSPGGWAEVDALRRRLRDEPAAAAYCSPLRRARDTASAAPSGIVGGLRYLTSLAEVSCGSLDGLPLSLVRAEHAELWRRNCAQDDAGFRWPGGESYCQLRRRVLRIFRCIGARHLGERALIFTHAGVINQIMGAIAGQSAARWENFRPANASITELRFDGDRFAVVRFDDRAHLPAASSDPPSG
jgi:broad specificity phosphatase PhoE